MLLHVILLLLFQFVDRNQSFVNRDGDLQEGSFCTLSNNRIGIWRKFDECRSIGVETGQSVVCCDVVRQQCEDTKQMKAVLTPHMKGRVGEAADGDFPFVASVEDGESVFRCAASIISSRFLLTAAHCVNIAQVRLGSVYSGDHEVNETQIKRVHRHPEYSKKKKQNDIALIELNQDIQMHDELIKPICLYTEQEDIPENTDLTVMGWGKTNNDDFSRMLLYGTVQPVSRSECQTRFTGYNIKFTENHMCALGSQNEKGIATDTCEGDSGGPLVLKQDGHWQLVGIVSTGPDCGTVHYAGIYTRVSRYLDWIVKVGVWNKTLV